MDVTGAFAWMFSSRAPRPEHQSGQSGVVAILGQRGHRGQTAHGVEPTRRKDFGDVADTRAAMSSGVDADLYGRTYNIATGSPTTCWRWPQASELSTQSLRKRGDYSEGDRIARCRILSPDRVGYGERIPMEARFHDMNGGSAPLATDRLKARQHRSSSKTRVEAHMADGLRAYLDRADVIDAV